MLSGITVALSTFREAYYEWVIELLKSLKDQFIDNFEVLIVVSGNRRYSRMLEKSVKRNLKLGFPTGILYNPLDRGIAHSRNIILEESKTQYIAYIDDDALPSPQWLKELQLGLKYNERAKSTTGPVIPIWDSRASGYSSWFPKELYWAIGCTPWGVDRLSLIRNGFTSNLLVERKAALDVGGFNESLGYSPKSRMTGEDPEFGIRLLRSGYNTVWNPKAIVYHRVSKERLKARDIIARSFLEGKVKAYLRKEYSESILDVETKHLNSILKTLITSKSLRSRVSLSSSTFAVLTGYLAYRILGKPPNEYVLHSIGHFNRNIGTRS